MPSSSSSPSSLSVRWTASAVRSTFLEFFAAKGHTVCESGPLAPPHDATLLFANAGMVPFKDVFVGKETRPFVRAVSSQKCMRISGKHNDLENVGVTARHHTFFEMLGNFSFGDYFKEQAIAYAWELLTQVYGLSPERLAVTVFGGDPTESALAPDNEARAIWARVSGLPPERIVGFGAKDNFWQMGETGPCGPCSEIYCFVGDRPDPALLGQEPDAEGRGWVEIWNLVFMQYERVVGPEGASLVPLPKPCVDTGAGLERLAAALQGKRSNYDSDLFAPLLHTASRLAGIPYRGGISAEDIAMRVLADHARAAAFLVAEGVFPDRTGREYVLRRVLRRAVRYGHRLGMAKPFLQEMVREVVRTMGAAYPELTRREELIASVVDQEEERFRETLDRGLEKMQEAMASVRTQTNPVLSGAVAFKLYDTFGFPFDLTQKIAAEEGVHVDEAGFLEELAQQRKLSEGSKVGEAAVGEVWHAVQPRVASRCPEGVTFVGYDTEESQGEVLALVQDGQCVEETQGQATVFVVTDKTPFYGEAGGQVGDRGEVTHASFAGKVVDTQKPLPGLVVHTVEITQGRVRVGDTLSLQVDAAQRAATRRNHSAAHLLHWALRHVLGEQATQKGSLVGPERLRFDVAHGRPLTEAERKRIETLVNAKILTAAPALTQVLPIEEARAQGAMAIFEEKYGKEVRMVTLTADSLELCGGTHVRSLGEIGLFKLISDVGVAAGVRRLEGMTGLTAFAYVARIEAALQQSSRAMRCTPEELPQRVDKMLEKVNLLEKECKEMQRASALQKGAESAQAGLAQARPLPGGGKVLAMQVEAKDIPALRTLAEGMRNALGDSVVLLGAKQGDSVALVLRVSMSLTGRYNAGELIRSCAQHVGGSGGGRPDMAQAGGSLREGLPRALATLYELLAPLSIAGTP